VAISSTERFLRGKGAGPDAALAYWGEDADSTIVHFIGKDIVNFHALFWPAVLKGARFKRPSRVVVHGMLTVNGEKMSKSRGTFINARQYLDLLDPSYLRYFYAANLGPSPEDLDLSLKEFRLKVNAELVNNLGNLVNRSLAILAGRLGGTLSEERNPAVLGPALAGVSAVRRAFDGLEFRSAVKAILEIGERANKFVQDSKPWEKVGTDKEEARRDLSSLADVAYLIGALLAPIVPRISEEIFAQLCARPLTFKDLETAPARLLPAGHTIGTPRPLIARIDEKVVEKLVVSIAAGEQKPEGPAPASQVKPVAATSVIASADDFAKLELRVGRVVSAERVPKSDKLLKLSVDLGESHPRTIAAGIAESFAPEQIAGKRVVVVANLAKRVIRGVESNGMLLAAGEDPARLTLVEVPGDLPPGTQVK
jgi:methionyl-tRNA synthetase